MVPLKLSGMRESVEYRLEEAMEADLAYQDFLCLILEDEKLYRENRKAERLRRRASFNDLASLEDFDTSPGRGVTKSMIKKLSSLDFVERNENIIFTGGTGAGKSYLAQSIGQKGCLNGLESLFYPVNKFLKEVEDSELAGNYLKFLCRIRKCKILIFDDFGLRNYSHKEASIFYDVLEERYQKGPVIITSQILPQGWKSLFEDEVIGEAIVDRLTSCAHTIDVRGASYRKNHKPKEKIESKK
jgi:DNA replication protein DnaC